MTARVSRRAFMHASAVAGGGLLVSFGWGAPIRGRAQTPASLQPSGFVRVDADGTVTIWSKNPDMGQGVKTALPMVLAEEMDADWSRVRALDAELDRAKFGGQGSGGSIRDEWDLYRNAGAAVRELLAGAAADTWGVPRDQVRTERGRVLHAPSNRALDYGALVDAAARRPVPSKPAWKPATAFTLLGTRVPGVDTEAIVHGRPLYGIDVRLPGMRYAAIAKCPVFNGAVASVDDTAALTVPGVRQVVRIGGHENPTFLMPGVAVVAESTWAAFKGRDALRVQWAEGEHVAETTASLSAQFAELAPGAGTTVRAVGDVDQALASAARVVEAYYESPFLSHATLEPVNCTADVRDGHCYITGPLQMQTSGARVVAAAIDLPVERVHVQVTRLGGGFGRRLLSDYAAEAAVVSKAIGAPVQIVGTREDDLRHDYYRPAGARRLRVGLDPAGRITAWDCHLVNISRNAYRRGDGAPWSTETYGLVAGVSNDLAPDFDLDLVPWQIPHVRLPIRNRVPAWPRAPGARRRMWPTRLRSRRCSTRLPRSRGDRRWTCGSSSTARPARCASRATTLRPTIPTAWRPCCAWRPTAVASRSGHRRAVCVVSLRTTRSARTARRSWSCRCPRLSRRREPAIPREAGTVARPGASRCIA